MLKLSSFDVSTCFNQVRGNLTVPSTAEEFHGRGKDGRSDPRDEEEEEDLAQFLGDGDRWCFSSVFGRLLLGSF